ncbi:centrosomal protein of 55 kDa-like isoform X2 [Syngnathus scovelli]|uniref:centrosomal protein of 55 kDa-like isoform X2 n=1 Tax=Syngnathus scovelli TaxID=161590 RepID=UPI00210FB6DD|nr:centrosomal protein of 55 kDa-like isoform X2 [Syngnathus scovelli]
MFPEGVFVFQIIQLWERTLLLLKIIFLKQTVAPQNIKYIVSCNRILEEMDPVSSEQDNASNEQFSSDVAELQKHLKDALDTNQQWLAYNQQREAYVRTVLDRMLWLESQLDQAVRAQFTQHNKEHSEDERISEMKQHFESLLAIGRDHLAILKRQLDVTLQDLADAKNRYEKKELEASELKQQLERSSEEKELVMDEVRALQWKLDEEKDRTAKLEERSSVIQMSLVKCHNASQDKIANLKRQVHTSSLDLEDEMENCSYLKTQLIKLQNMLRRRDDQLAYYEKRKQQEEDYKEDDGEPIYEEMRPCGSSSPNDSSSLVCPVCGIQCPFSQYRQMMDHLEVCLSELK